MARGGTGIRINGAALRAVREARLISVTSLAREVGVKSQHISNIEVGERNPSPELLGRICTALLIKDPRALMREDLVEAAS